MNYQLLQGDNRQVMRTLPAKSVHCIATSSPYFNLRAYSGDQDVDWEAMEYSPMPGLPPISIPAWRGSLGNEPTIEAFIGHLLLCLRECHRALRDDGCCFWNLGDSYNGSGGSGGDYNAGGIREGQPKAKGSKVGALKNKDLCMVPARFALAAQADGWYVRSRIIWAKGVSFMPNYAGSCMPESVTDRPTKSDEDIYLLTKQPNYFWDQEAVKEQSIAGYNGSRFDVGKSADARKHLAAISTRDRSNQDGSSGRSLRSVWVINPQPFSAKDLGFDNIDHFAVWPSTLVTPMIKAATSEHGCCTACGAQWERVVERCERLTIPRLIEGREGENTKMNGPSGWNSYKTTGFRPTCTCNADIVPATVLDPFNGSGTTGATAAMLGRDYIGIDLSADYIELAHARIREAINASGRVPVVRVGKVTDFADMPLFAD